MPIAQLKNEQDPAEVADEKCNRFTCDLILSAGIWLSIGTENLVPEEVNYTKISISVTMMNKVQFLLASEPRKPLKPRSLYVIFLVEKDMRVK